MTHRPAPRRHATAFRAALAAAATLLACHAAAATPASAKLSEEEQAILCLDVKGMLSLKDEMVMLGAMATRVDHMQSAIDDLRKLIEAMPDNPRPAAVTPPVPVPVPIVSPPPPVQDAGLPWLPLAGGGLVLALAVLLWSRRRHPPPMASLATEIPHDIGVPTAQPAAAAVARPAEPRRAAAAPTAPASTAAAAPVLPAPTPAPQATADEEPFGESDLPMPDQALELANVMVSMGLTQGATDTLIEHIRANPRRALFHWLKLLDIYKTTGKKDEFEKSAADLRRNFNIQASDWEPTEAPSPQSIEDYAHLYARIQQLWRQPGCIGFMARLLEDNRGGARLGFPQSVAEEILLLISICRDAD